MNSKKLLALLLAATLLTGSLCGPVFAARAGQTAGAEFLEEIPPETIFTEKTDASAEGEAAGEYSTALETAAEEPAGTADPEAPDASMDQSMDQSSEQIGENSLDAFSDGADLLEEPGDPSQQAEDDAVEAPSEETDPAEDTEDSAQQPEDIVVDDPSEETDLTEDSGDPAQQAEDVVVEEPSEETDLTEDSEDPAQQPEDGIVEEPSEEADLPEDSEDPAQQPEDFAVEEPSEETDLAEDTEDPAQTAEDAAEAPSEETDAVEEPARQPEDDAADVPSEETEPAEDPGDSTQQAGEDAGQDLPAEDGTEVLPEDGLIEDQDQAEIAEEEAMAGILEGETALADQILQDDMTIDGDAYLSSGIVDLNGHTLTINGSLVQPGGAMQINGGYLEVTGDYRIQNRNDAGDYSYGGGVLVMTNENDYVKVEGELYVSGFHDFSDRNNVYVENTLTAGTLEIGAGLHQNGRREAFRAQGAHRTLITGAGAGQQASVSFDSPDSWMGILEAGDGASIDWEGYFNVQKLGSDVQIHTPAEEGGGISVYSNNGRMDFGGHTLTVDGNVKTVVGKLYVGGADLAGEGFDPEAAGALTINGNLLQPEGAVIADGGRITVTGDYRIQHRNDSGDYSYGGGVLVMTNENDYVKVEGELYVSGFHDFSDRNNVYVENTLTAGTLEIGAGLHQSGRNEAFRAQDAHRTLITGAGADHQASVSFDSPASWMGILEAGDGASIDWTGYFNVQKLGSDVQIHTPAEEGDGISVYSDNGRMDFGGHTLTVDGNVKTVVGKLYVGGADLAGESFDPEAGGALTINGNLLQPEGAVIADGGRITVTGDYRIQHRNDAGNYSYGSGVLVMTNENDYVKVGGELYVSGFFDFCDRDNNEVANTLTAGTLEIGAGLHQNGRNEAFRAQDAHRTLITGAGADHQASVSFDSPNSWMGILEAGDGASIDWTGYFNVQKLGSDVQIHTPAEEGDGISVYSDNGRMDFGGHTLTVDGNVKTVVGKLYVGGADLAGEGFDPEGAGALTINGNLLQPEGAVIADGGRITVTGDYRIQHRNDAGNYSYGSGVLVMTNENDYVKVGGELYVSGFYDFHDRNNVYVENTLTAGTLEIGAGLHQSGRNEAFRARDAHRTLITGAGAEKKSAVSFDNPNSWMGILEAGDGASIDWTGYFNVQKLGSDVQIHTPAEEGDGISVYSNNGRMDFGGHTLTIDGNVKTVVGKLYVGGADLAGEGFDPEAAGALTINGNLLQPEGAVIADGGRITVTGDYRIQHRNDAGDYSYGGGVLVMTNENDYVKVEGELYVSGFHDFRDRNDVYVENTLTAGTLELEGNFCQNGRREAFRASGSHRTILRGDGVQAVQMESADSWFNILDLQNDLSEYIFGLVPCWAVLTRNGEPVGDEAVAAIPYTASVNEKDKTLTILSWKDESAEIVIPDQLNGYTVTGIGREVFRNRTSMEGITLPANLTEIGEAAFRGCTAITGIEFPAALTVIGSNAFRDCTSLTTVTFAEGSTLETIRNSAFENDKLLESVAIPEGTSKIGEYAFYDCSALKKVTMPGTVNEMGIQVFRNTALTTAGPSGSGADYEFGWTTEIPAYGFDWIDTLTEITLPEGITKLGRNAIAECRSLTQVGLPASLRTMGEEVFSGCEKLPRIDFPNGIRILPARALRRCLALKEVSLPASLTTIKNSAFERCESLEEIVLPEGLEEIESYAFTDCKSLMGVAFPEGLTYLPDRCLINCRSLEEVTLPDSLREIRGWAFENCESLTVLEIPDGVTTIRSLAFKNAKNLTQLIVPESVTTLDNDAILETNSSSLVMYVVPGSTAEQYAIDHGISYENLTNTGSAVSVKVTDPNGETIVNGYSVSWYASDSDTLLGTGKKLRNVQAGTQVVCRVILNEELGSLYIQPDDVTYTAGSTDGTAEITLRAFETITVRGTVKDAEGAAIPNAALELKQTLNGMYDKTVEAQADEAGTFTLNAKKARAALTVSAEGYYDGAYAVSESSIQEGTAVVNAVLEKIPADKITLTLGRQTAAVPGEEPEITVQTNANGLVLSVYNETKQKSVKDFRFQYPYLNLGGDAAAAGDRIRLSLQDENKVLTAEDVTVTLDENRCGSAEWLLVENGKLRLDGIKASGAENSRSTVMIFDASGRIMESGTAAGSYASKPLSAGDYTLVLIEKTALLQGLDSFGRLAELGLAEGTDFVRQNVTINNGVITVLENVTVPDLDETKLYYTVDNATRFWTAAGKVTTGQYVTLRATYEIDRQKAAQTSGETLTFEIPDGLTFVQGSLTSDGRAAACTVQEDDETGSTQVTVRMNTGKGTVRFYVVPTSSGVKKAHAYLSFKKGTEDVMQPVGAVSVGVEAASISVPSRTGFKKVTVSGKTARGSEVTVYDNGQAVGTTETNKNGTWSLEFDLVRPLKYSYHEIYAQVENSEYGDIETEKAGILYNANFVQVSKVTMINTAHPSSNLRPTEYRTVFDFLHPESTVPTYNYWPSYPTFTFLVEFTGESVEGISNVRVITTNAAGDRTAVTCTYDEAGGVWVGTRDYRSFSDVPCKVAVKCDNASGDAIDDSMDMDDMAEFLAEARNIDESAGPLVEEFANIQNETIANERVSFDFTAGDEKLGEYSMVLLDYADFDLEAWKKDRYVEFEGSDGSISYEAGWLTDETYTIYTAYPDDEIYIKEVVRLTPGASAQGTASKSGAGFRAPLAGSAVYDPARKSLSLDEWTDTVTAGYKANGDIGKGFKQITGIQDAIDLGNDFLNVGANESTLRYALGEYKNAIIRKNCKCITKDMKDGYWRDAEDIEKQIDDYVRRANILMGGTYAAGLVMDYCGGKVLKFGGKLAKLGCKKLYKAAMKRYGGKVSRSVRRAVFHGAAIIANEAGGYVEKKMGDLTKYVTGLFDVKGVVQDGFISLRDYIRNSIRALNVYKCPCEKGGGKCECDPNQEDPDEEPEEEPDEHGGGPDGGGYTGIRSATPIADPSGYVYEAVPSNRVEGVTATIYQYAEIIDYDEYGEETGRRKEEVKWDAENYDQVNPQTTDTYGIFGWDVPEGSWVVKFNKEGYEDADSYNDAAATYAGENGKHYLPVPPIQTEVNTAMVSTAAPEVAGVSAYEGEIDIDFSQYMQIDTVNTSNVTVTAAGGTAVTGTIEPLNAEDNYDGTARYASSFAFRPAQTAGALAGTVTVAVKNVKNYAGTAIAAAYSGQHAVTVMPRSLEITGETGMLHHDSTELTIRVLPAEAGAGRTLTITSYSPSIVSVGQQTVTTDENGLASVTLEGSLPGQGILEIALDGTKIAEEKQITVTARQAAPAIRSLEDGNAAITLETEGLTYDGREKKPAVRVSYDGSDLEEGTDYTVAYSNNIKAGTDTAKVTVTGTGLYEGTLEQTFSIARAALASADVTLASGTYTYNGKSQKPAVTVKHGGKKLASGTDYSVTYSDNVHAGTASVKVAGKGNYKGTVTKKFTIAKAAQSIKLTVDATKIAVGKTTAIKVSGTKGSISFKSASEKLATVKKKDSKTGTVKAVKVGKVKITVTAAKTSDFNAVSKAVTISVVPAATSTFKADNQAAGIMLTWKKVAGANAYIIYRGSTQIAAIKNGSTVTYTDKKANTNGTKYTYKIIASASSTGRSTLSKSVTTYRVARPAISTLTNSGAKKMTVKWGKNAKASGYQIQYSTDKTFKTGNNSATISGASTVAKAITGLTKGKTYYVRIRTFKTAGSTKYFSAWSPVKNVKITK